MVKRKARRGTFASRLEGIEHLLSMRERAAVLARACVALSERCRHSPRTPEQAQQQHVQNAAMVAPSSRMPPRGPGSLFAPRARPPARVSIRAVTQVDTRLSASLCAVALASEHGALRPLPVACLAT